MLSALDLFSIGIGPSSSHTMGPLKAAAVFIQTLQQSGQLNLTRRVQIDLYGSLALTGMGHGTHRAVLAGLAGADPDNADPDDIAQRLTSLDRQQTLLLAGRQAIAFSAASDLLSHGQQFLPRHANALKLTASQDNGDVLLQQTWYSVGGGHIVEERDWPGATAATGSVPYPYRSAAELLAHCRQQQCGIAAIARANALASLSPAQLRQRISRIADAMQQCIAAGLQHDGILPGGLNVRRRAPALWRKLRAKEQSGQPDAALPWPTLFALAVNEENAAGGRVVTAPTNGAAGIVPAVLEVLRRFHAADEQMIEDFLLTAGAIGLLYKYGASLSGAEVGCQGEVGVACSMAAGALTAVLGGSAPQVENAAEIAMEHHLGLTCDPVKGLVQIPCIERNGVAAEQAIKISQLALLEDGEHKVSLDTVIATMLATGRDMKLHYKETSLGGLAVNQPEC